MWFNVSSSRKQKQKTSDSSFFFFAHYVQKRFLTGGLGFVWPGIGSVGEIGIHVIMNGQIKQRRGEVWLFTSMRNFSHHGQTVEMGAKNVSWRNGKFHQLFIKKRKKIYLMFFLSLWLFFLYFLLLGLLCSGADYNRKKWTKQDGFRKKKLEISHELS